MLLVIDIHSKIENAVIDNIFQFYNVNTMKVVKFTEKSQ